MAIFPSLELSSFLSHFVTPIPCQPQLTWAGLAAWPQGLIKPQLVHIFLLPLILCHKSYYTYMGQHSYQKQKPMHFHRRVTAATLPLETSISCWCQVHLHKIGFTWQHFPSLQILSNFIVSVFPLIKVFYRQEGAYIIMTCANVLGSLPPFAAPLQC